MALLSAQTISTSFLHTCISFSTSSNSNTLSLLIFPVHLLLPIYSYGLEMSKSWKKKKKKVDLRWWWSGFRSAESSCSSTCVPHRTRHSAWVYSWTASSPRSNWSPYCTCTTIEPPSMYIRQRIYIERGGRAFWRKLPCDGRVEKLYFSSGSFVELSVKNTVSRVSPQIILDVKKSKNFQAPKNCLGILGATPPASLNTRKSRLNKFWRSLHKSQFGSSPWSPV